MPLVSIITPSYNQAAYLEQAMLSVLRQDLGRGLELEYLVVDGGSSDGSLEIIQRYADRLAWWVSERDAGQAEAINKGFRRARGEIVAWLNSDDIYLPGAVASAARALLADPNLGLVFGDALTIDADGRPLKRLAFGDWSLVEMMRFRIICQPSVFMNKAFLQQAGLLDPSYHFMLDHHLWVRMARLAPIRHVPSLWAAARHHPGAKNVAQAAGFGDETLRVLAWMQSQPDLAALVRRDWRAIQAGANRLNARYLLDGGLPGPALRAYARALWYGPGYALQHWRRMLYAAVSLIAGKQAADWFYRRAPSDPARRPDLSTVPGVQDWPGLQMRPLAKRGE